MPLQFRDIKTGLSITPDLNKLKEIMSSLEYYQYILSEDISLDVLKDARICLLKDECSQAIYNGFLSESTGYYFGFNQLDQINLTQQMLLILTDTNNQITEVHWKTKNAGVVTFTKQEFLQIVEEAKQHKLTQQQKYWNLEKQILNATDKATIESIVW